MASAEAAHHHSADGAFRQEPKRWWMLALLSLLSMMNANLIFQFSSLFALTTQAFDTDVYGVNTLVNTQAFVYLPGTILGLFISQRLGLRWVLVVAALLNVAGAVLHYVASVIPTGKYAVLVIGNVFAGFGQPLLFNAPARLSALWFGAHERDVSTAVGALSNPVGNAIASVVPPLVVMATSDFPQLLGATMGVAVGMLALTLWTAQDRPAAPPSASAAATWHADDASHGASLTTAMTSTLSAFASLARNGNFVRFALGMGIGMGMATALLAVVAQLIAPCGYNADVAGFCGAAMLGLGLLMAAVVMPTLERTRTYVAFLRAFIMLSVGAVLFMLSSLTPGSPDRLYASFSLLGAFLLPLMPISTELAVELTFPAPEDESVGFMWNLAFLVQIGVLYGITPLMALPVTQACNTVATPSAGLILACLLVAAVLLCSVRPDYRRQAVEKERREKGAGDEEAGREGKEAASAGADATTPAPLLLPTPSSSKGRVLPALMGAGEEGGLQGKSVPLLS